MTMLAEHVDGVIGVDTHRDILAAAAVSLIGAILETTDAPAHRCGCRRLLGFGRPHCLSSLLGTRGDWLLRPASPSSSRTPVNASSRSAAPHQVVSRAEGAEYSIGVAVGPAAWQALSAGYGWTWRQ
ncbi:hypothetical protein ABK046_40750 [Streptomyces caeruleatus]